MPSEVHLATGKQDKVIARLEVGEKAGAATSAATSRDTTQLPTGNKRGRICALLKRQKGEHTDTVQKKRTTQGRCCVQRRQFVVDADVLGLSQ